MGLALRALEAAVSCSDSPTCSDADRGLCLDPGDPNDVLSVVFKPNEMRECLQPTGNRHFDNEFENFLARTRRQSGGARSVLPQLPKLVKLPPLPLPRPSTREEPLHGVWEVVGGPVPLLCIVQQLNEAPCPPSLTLDLFSMRLDGAHLRAEPMLAFQGARYALAQHPAAMEGLSQNERADWYEMVGTRSDPLNTLVVRSNRLIVLNWSTEQSETTYLRRIQPWGYHGNVS